MATKKYLSLDRLAEYDTLIKAKIDKGDASALSLSKEYTDKKIEEIPEVDAYTKSEMDSALASAKEYTDEAVANLLNNSTEAVDSIYELRDAMQENAGAIETLVEISGSKADKEHTHAIADVTGLQGALDAKATQTSLDSLTEVVNGKAASVHTHTISEVTNLQTTLDAKATQANLDSHTGDTVKHITADERAAWNAIEGKAKTYTDEQIAAIPTPDVSGQISSHNSNASAHGDIRKLISDVEASIPDALSDLTADSTHRTVTDSEKATWNAKSNFSGNYNDLTNKPSIPSIAGLATEKYVDDSVSTKVDKVTGKGLSTNDYTTTEKNKLSGIATGAEVNQNAFSNVVVGSTTISADSKTDSLTIDAGTGISVAGDATNDKVTITNSGVRSIATGSANGTISVNTNGTSVDVSVKGLGSAAYTSSTAYDAAGTAKAKADDALNQSKGYTDEKIALLMNNSSAAVDSIMELAEAMEANDDVVEALETAVGNKADKSDLTNHINNKSNPHGVTLEQLGVTATAAELNIMDGVTATAAEINKLDGVTATTAELNYVDGVTSNIQTQLNAKQATVTGAATTITGSNLTASRALVSNSSGKVAVSAVTSTELGYLDGVTSNIQEQLDTKATVQIITWGADD